MHKYDVCIEYAFNIQSNNLKYSMTDEIPLVDKSPKAKKKRDEFPDDPPETEWDYVLPCQWIPLARLTEDNRFFFRGIEIKFQSLILVFVSSLILFTFFVYYSFVLSQFKGTIKLISIIETLTVTILFLWSYFAAACMDPGFLPYDWYRTQNYWYSWEDQLSGLATTETQIVFVDMHERPNNASFSRSAGRFVIRGDHICDWISNWVGKRNHKQFLLLMFWGILYCFSMPFWSFFADSKNLSSIQYSMVMISMILEMVFGTSLIIIFILSMALAMRSQTKIQKMKNQEIINTKSCDESLEEICGKGTKLLWCLPFPAFGKEL